MQNDGPKGTLFSLRKPTNQRRGQRMTHGKFTENFNRVASFCLQILGLRLCTVHWGKLKFVHGKILLPFLLLLSLLKVMSCFTEVVMFRIKCIPTGFHY